MINNIKKREEYILHLLEVSRRVSTEKLCEQLGLSPSSVRRQLSDMEKRGLLLRTYGGAVSIDAGHEIPVEQKTSVNIRGKRVIAAAARPYIRDGETIALGGGSTILELCSLLMDLKRAVVLTDSVVAANVLMKNPNIELWINGGIIHGSAGYVIGPDATAVFDTKIDKAFLGAEAIDFERGVYSASIGNANVERAIGEAASEVFILADYTKMNRKSIVPVLPLEKVDCIITDSNCDPECVKRFQERDIQVVIGGQPEPHSSQWRARRTAKG